MRNVFDSMKERALVTVKHLESILTKNNGSYGEKATDLCCYYKSPMLFVVAGRPDLAELVLSHITSSFMTPTGDFETKAGKKSTKPEYSDYWSYTNGWIVRAAQKIDKSNDLSYKYLMNFYKGKNLGFLTNSLESKNEITDVLTTAHHGLINLERDHLELAISSGEFLCSVIQKQPDPENIFYFRFGQDNNPVVEFPDEKSPFFCMKKNQKDQLYFMVGYPSAFLALLYKKTKETKYLVASKKYLDIALTYKGNVLESNFSHKIAWAASILLEITGDRVYLPCIMEIATHFLKTQEENGMWYNDDIPTSFDQSAEIACWLIEIDKNLLQYQKNLEKKQSQNEKVMMFNPKLRIPIQKEIGDKDCDTTENTQIRSKL